MATNYKSKIDLDLLRDAANKKFAIVYSEWNDDIVNRLVNGAIKFFSMIGLKKEEIALCSVPEVLSLYMAVKNYVMRINMMQS